MKTVAGISFSDQELMRLGATVLECATNECAWMSPDYQMDLAVILQAALPSSKLKSLEVATGRLFDDEQAYDVWHDKIKLTVSDLIDKMLPPKIPRHVNHSTSFYPSVPTSMIQIHELPAECGVYFVWWEGRCVYVGQSSNMASRVTTSHEKLKPFDSLSFLLFPNRDVVFAEHFYIGTVRPERNDCNYANGGTKSNVVDKRRQRRERESV